VGPCSKLSPLVVNLDCITVGELSRICVRPGYPELRGGIMLCQRWQRSSLIVERMEVCQCPAEGQRQRIRRSLVHLVHRPTRVEKGLALPRAVPRALSSSDGTRPLPLQVGQSSPGTAQACRGRSPVGAAQLVGAATIAASPLPRRRPTRRSTTTTPQPQSILPASVMQGTTL
jgi:hypothetical protein